MKKNVITLKRDEPIYIPTVHGVIEVAWTDKDNRKIDVILPEGLRVVKGRKEAETDLFVLHSGKLEPKFKRLVPQFDEQGEYTGVRASKGFEVSNGKTS